VNPSIWLRGKLVLKPKHPSKLADDDLTPLPIDHPYQLLPISIKIQRGVELVDNFLVPIILEAHRLRHLQLITSSLDLIKDNAS
jgi:hypothetical protein